jgi:hypothetical protein
VLAPACTTNALSLISTSRPHGCILARTTFLQLRMVRTERTCCSSATAASWSHTSLRHGAFSTLPFPGGSAGGEEGEGKAAPRPAPAPAGIEKPWWDEYYTNVRKIRDCELFA